MLHNLLLVAWVNNNEIVSSVRYTEYALFTVRDTQS